MIRSVAIPIFQVFELCSFEVRDVRLYEIRVSDFGISGFRCSEISMLTCWKSVDCFFNCSILELPSNLFKATLLSYLLLFLFFFIEVEMKSWSRPAQRPPLTSITIRLICCQLWNPEPNNVHCASTHQPGQLWNPEPTSTFFCTSTTQSIIPAPTNLLISSFGVMCYVYTTFVKSPFSNLPFKIISLFQVTSS